MDNFFLRRYSSGTQQSSSLWAGLRMLNRVLHLLAGLIRLTEEEQEDAGIYLGGEPHA